MIESGAVLPANGFFIIDYNANALTEGVCVY